MNIKFKKHDLLIIECSHFMKCDEKFDIRDLVIRQIHDGIICLPPGYTAKLYNNVHIADVTIQEIIKFNEGCEKQ